MTNINTAFLPPSMLTPEGEVKPEFADDAREISQGIQARAESLPPAQRALFLAAITTPSLAPTSNEVTTDLDGTLDRYEAASAKLIALFESIDTGDTLGRLMVEMAGMQRKEALENRLLAREAAKGAMLDQAGKLQEAADKMRTGAIVALIITIVVAVITVAASVASAKADMKGIKGQKMDLEGQQLQSQGQHLKSTGDEALGTATEQAGLAKRMNAGDMNYDAAKSRLVGQMISSLGQTGQGIARSIDTFFQADAKDKEAEGQVFAAMAEYLRGQADISKDVQNQMDELIKKVIDFLKQIKEAEVNQMAAVTRG